MSEGTGSPVTLRPTHHLIFNDYRLFVPEWVMNVDHLRWMKYWMQQQLTMRYPIPTTMQVPSSLTRHQWWIVVQVEAITRHPIRIMQKVSLAQGTRAKRLFESSCLKQCTNCETVIFYFCGWCFIECGARLNFHMTPKISKVDLHDCWDWPADRKAPKCWIAKASSKKAQRWC